MKRWSLLLFGILSFPALGQPRPSADRLQSIHDYIRRGWDTLTRSTASCAAIPDTKVSTAPVLYLPADMAVPSAIESFKTVCPFAVEHLPRRISPLGTAAVEMPRVPGLLYLKNKYVVPGGRFNEMYGWDSYFIIRGLLRDGRLDLARGMVDNFFFEIENYGAVLNANRSYYLTRSQPPFLSSMVMAVHEAQSAARLDDSAWLQTAYDYIRKDHALWTRGQHLAGDTGLSRYYDFGDGPALEAVQDENDIYRQVASYLLLHPSAPALVRDVSEAPSALDAGAPFSVRICGPGPGDSSCEPPRLIRLMPDYYKADRSMRESGFDISFRFGPYGSGTHHFAPVCLNSLLYKTERDLEDLSRLLHKEADATQWHALAESRRLAMRRHLWNAEKGLFLDYDFENGKQSDYVFAATFYPLWAGLASKEQAHAVLANLNFFEKPGGVVTSTRESPGQWDFPYGWAPLQLIAVEGMRRYGDDKDADRISSKFLLTVLENFERDRTIREKYNVVTRSLETKVTAGYSANVVGFGWTNGVFLELLHALPPDAVRELETAVSAGH